MAMKQKSRRDNIYFRQTPKEFASMRQTQIFAAIKRNIPYNMFKFSKDLFNRQLQKFNQIVQRQKEKFAKRKTVVS
ncbi:hypothetical protein HY008_01820 [Candidatus Woesebacteria bacterium]|nr:hypothetical protein [Candidatus Woesebacteria bacterium]